MKKFLFISSILLSFFPLPSFAAGFYIQEQSVSGQGAAFAGAAAEPRDASTISTNPAGMAALTSSSAVAETSVIVPRASFSDKGSTAGLTSGGPGAQAAYAGGDGGDPFGAEAVPALYAAAPVDAAHQYWIGIGVSAPFGLSNKYDAGWFGRYNSTKNDLQTIDIAPVAAARLSDYFSVGGGLDIQRADATLENALPCPAAGFGCGAAFTPATDGRSSLAGNSWDVGFNLGALWQPRGDTRIGVGYRSGIHHEIDGKVTVSGLSGGLAGSNGVRQASAELNLPDIVNIGVAQDVNDRLTLLGSYSWYGWNSFKEIRVKFDAGGDDVVEPESYKNTSSVALGAEWKQTDALTLRGGVQYDQTPTVDATRDTRTADADRYWLSLGASYAFSGAFTVDGAVTHIFMPDADVDLTRDIYAGTGAETTNVIEARAENQIDIISLQATARF